MESENASGDKAGVRTATSNTTQALDHNRLLYLHSTDVGGISLISLQLTSSTNYSL